MDLLHGKMNAGGDNVKKERTGAPVLPQDTALGIIGSHLIKPDPLGSYTGNYANPFEPPVQDADDL